MIKGMEKYGKTLKSMEIIRFRLIYVMLTWTIAITHAFFVLLNVMS